jgi:hypothetical protein
MPIGAVFTVTRLKIESHFQLHPWRYRSWIFPRDPLFLEKAAPILDLYQGVWQGLPLGPEDLYFPRTKSRAFQHDVGSTLRFPPPLPFQLASNTSTSAREPGSTWPPGTTASPPAFDGSDSHAEPCQLAQPSGDLLLYPFTGEDLAKLMIRLRAKAVGTAA